MNRRPSLLFVNIIQVSAAEKVGSGCAPASPCWTKAPCACSLAFNRHITLPTRPSGKGPNVMSYRPTIHGTRHAVSAGHYLAAAAGFTILEAGGNAIDAGVAAGIALGVLQPDLVNPAGVAPIIIYDAKSREVITIAGLGPWPRALDPELFMREHGGKIPVGVLRTVVPAAPDAWITALRRYGTMSFG